LVTLVVTYPSPAPGHFNCAQAKWDLGGRSDDWVSKNPNTEKFCEVPGVN
jgi:hypothetical protein